MAKPNADVIRDLFAAYERGDEAVMRALLADDVTYRVPGRNPFSGAHHGPGKVIELWDRQKAYLGGHPYQARAYDLAVTEDHVIMLATVTAQRGRSTHQFETANIYRLVGARVAECRVHVFDLHAFDEFWSGGDPRAVANRWVRALNEHDLEAAANCFAPEYHDSAPARPGEEVHGRDQVRKNFRELLAGVPDLRAEIQRAAAEDDVLWMEWRMSGTRTDGVAFEFVGVNLFGVASDEFVWGRIYTDLVTSQGDIESQLARMTGSRGHS